MARREVTGKKPAAVALDNGPPDPKKDDEPPPTPKLAFSIKQFCAAHSISEDFYYKLKRQKKNPKEMLVGSRVLISIEAAEAWRREQEGTRNTAAA
jgi:hypothetical protein